MAAAASYLGDVLAAAKLVIKKAPLSPSLRAWVVVPPGITAILAGCFAIDTLLRRLSVTFPASVAAMVLLLAALLLSEVALGAQRTRRLVGWIDVPAGWSLRWISLYFTPAFVLLPLSPPIGIAEVGKIVAVFIIGFFVMMALAAYMTRSLQLLLGSSKRALAERAEELDGGIANDSPPQDLPLASRRTSISQATSTVPLRPTSRPQSPPSLRLNDQGDMDQDGRESAAAQALPAYPAQTAPAPPRAERWAVGVMANIDACVFAVLLLCVGLPLYYGAGYAMPLHLTVNILAYLASLAIPHPWKQALHPVLVSSLIAVLLIWPLALARGDSLTTALTDYRTGSRYLRLWSDTTTRHRPPGAGDMLGTLLDAAIVALALPMFQYRRELRVHFIPIVVPAVLIAMGSLFAYPPLCHAIGIAAPRSLAFASRSLTLALATPATENLGGDVNTVAALAIVSGILGVLVGQWLLGLMRIPADDYVTRGVTLGVNSSAIATALLLRTDPRAAALSSLSMSLFGTVTVLFTSIPPIAALVRSTVGL
ncbi:hypothetical protein S7711_09790 [Stachybotrys chartarum IBT 7711]|uniref:LrgB-like protein n=1 Tax=Stachybotrys chartarum (strain CBS 109288 / IBT 7711) TaxID=1280523 RepID=A0A084AT61_STACB|nr:hypothetical protein S7711_09790 [Stachybotrys chartarum IBT 7711]